MTKRVLITGGASGLGWALARQYHADGWHVLLVDRDADGLEPRRCELGARCETFKTDVADVEESIRRLSPLFDQPLDLLINNAGITHRSPASATDWSVFQRVMAVNWLGPVWLTQRCLPALQQQRGGVVCISSMAALMPVPGRAGYCASKAAMAQHFEVWRPELLRRGIDLLMVYPSFLATAIEINALGHDGQPTKRLRSTVGAIGNVDDMAAAIVRAQSRRRKRLLTRQGASRLGGWLWTHLPWLYERLVWRRFAEEYRE